MAPPEPSPRRGVLRRLLFSVAVTLVFFGSAEALVRLNWQPASTGMTAEGTALTAHPTRIWGLPPGGGASFGASYSIWDNGLRAVEVTGAPYRALTTGDSSIFGHGLADEDTLHAALRDAMARVEVPVDVFCGGVPGYSTEQTRALLDEVGWSLNPDLLIVGNLWSDNDVRPFSDREWMNALRTPASGLERLMQSSSLWRLARRTFEPPAEEALPVGWVRDPYATGRRRVSLTEDAENLDAVLVEAASRRVGAVMLSPCNRILADPTWTRDTSWRPYFEAMERVAERRSVPLVKGCDVLKAAQMEGDAAFLDEMHPTGAVNVLYARALVRALRVRGWPSQRVLPDRGPALWEEALVDSWDIEENRPKSEIEAEGAGHGAPMGPPDGGGGPQPR